MSLTPSAQRAVEWLEQQLAELAGIRNATPRDPSFKNWRQGTLTTLQRIWPGDQDRSERFRRIPFSPVDPRADVRIIREWYSRGCQEAARVITGFIEDVRQNGVPEVPVETVASEVDTGFEDDFPTLDLPAGDLSDVATEPAEVPSSMSQFVDDVPYAVTAGTPAPPSLPSEIPAISNAAPEVHASDSRLPRKGVGARLKDLLGFAQLSAKALAGFPREATPSPSLPSLDAPVSASLPSMDVLPLGGEVTNDKKHAGDATGLPPLVNTAEDEMTHAPPVDGQVRSAPPKLAVSLPDQGAPQASASASGLWPLPRPVPEAATPAASTDAPPALASPAASAAPAAPAAPASPVHEPGMSVVMSRPTTLRGAIEKVSIESLLSDQFRKPAVPVNEPPAVQPTAPEALEQMVSDMLSAESASAATAAPAEPATPAEPVLPAALEPADDRPLAQAPLAPFDALAGLDDVDIPEVDTLEDEDEDESPPVLTPRPFAKDSRVVQVPPRRRSARGERSEADDDSAVGKVDPDAFERATEDFMRSSPVLGATGRRVKRANNEETGFEDPDAIAVASMLQELGRLDVPAGRQPEVRARLLDLARRIEKGELDWTALRKAVWFAMEYPEIARRLMPVLLPWIDRAA